MQVAIPKSVSVVELETAPFRNAKEADEWALSHGIVGLMSDEKKVLSGTARIVILPNDKASIDVSILLNGVLDVNGAPLVK